MANQVSGLFSPFLRQRRISAAASYLSGGRVLDFGCGVGELARFIDPPRYLGVDSDAASLAEARARRPSHTFLNLPEFHSMTEEETFDVIVALALIEHLADPADWLRQMRARLRNSGMIVLTTPRPELRWAHEMGARLHLFSRAAAEEHQTLLGQAMVRDLAEKADLRVARYQPFLLGCNQLFVLLPAAQLLSLPRT